jgi:hypothetical protein
VKPFTNIAIVIFILMAVAHLIRLIFGLEIIVNGTVIPVWLSAIPFVAFGGLAYMLLRESYLKTLYTKKTYWKSP